MALLYHTTPANLSSLFSCAKTKNDPKRAAFRFLCISKISHYCRYFFHFDLLALGNQLAFDTLRAFQDRFEIHPVPLLESRNGLLAHACPNLQFLTLYSRSLPMLQFILPEHFFRFGVVLEHFLKLHGFRYRIHFFKWHTTIPFTVFHRSGTDVFVYQIFVSKCNIIMYIHHLTPFTEHNEYINIAVFIIHRFFCFVKCFFELSSCGKEKNEGDGSKAQGKGTPKPHS